MTATASGSTVCTAADYFTEAHRFRVRYSVDMTGEVIGGTDVSWGGIEWDTANRCWKRK